jgi:hypothetical protein
MDDETRKMMSEWLGECWHEYDLGGFRNLEEYFMCDRGYPLCNKCNSHNIFQRTFTAPGDFFAVKNRMVELGLFVKFYMWAWDNWFETGPEWWSARFANWLIDPARFCQLAADFLKERKDADK